MGLLASSFYCLKGRGKVGIRQHHTHTYLLHQQDRQYGAQQDWSQDKNWFCSIQPATTTSPPSLPYFYSCYPKLLAQPCVLVTPPWTERKVKTSWPCGCSSCPSSSLSPSFPWQCCTKQSNPEGKKSLQSPVLKWRHIYFEQAPNAESSVLFFERSSQSVIKTDWAWLLDSARLHFTKQPWQLLICSSVQMLAITAHTDMKCRYAGLIRAEKI